MKLAGNPCLVNVTIDFFFFSFLFMAERLQPKMLVWPLLQSVGLFK